MGIRITDSDHVAIYDSVSDWAFGPVFDSEESAQKFLNWTVENCYGADLRSMTPSELESVYGRYAKDQPNPDSLEDLPI